MSTRSRQLFALGGVMLLSLLPGASPAVGAGGVRAADHASIRLARVLESEITGISAPVGLAASPENARLLVVGSGASSAADVTTVNRFGRRTGVMRLGQGTQDPINIAVDGHYRRLLLLTGASGEVLDVREDAAGNLDPRTLRRHNASRFGIHKPSGMTVDPATGKVFFLDEGGPRILTVQPGADGTFTGATV